jgi:hypothetical protein
MKRKTIFSAGRHYRYVLWREWEAANMEYAMFIGLNPSTADEVRDDPTIRRCAGYARRWGYGALCMTNLFAYRCNQTSCAKSPRPANRCGQRHLAGPTSGIGRTDSGSVGNPRRTLAPRSGSNAAIERETHLSAQNQRWSSLASALFKENGTARSLLNKQCRLTKYQSAITVHSAFSLAWSAIFNTILPRV